MELDDFDFDLPERLIALRPAVPRRASRLLAVGPSALREARMADLPRYLRVGDRLVFNDTRVIPARLIGLRRRDSAHGSGEARIEATLIRREGPNTWAALARPGKRLAEGDRIGFGTDHALIAHVAARRVGGEVLLRFDLSGKALDRAVAETGEMPLPPYIAGRRPADARDKADYQTVYAARDGSVAAPTAGLHFDDALLADLAAVGIGLSYVTLHVGPGTFLPVTARKIADHKMHAEWGEIGPGTAAEINATRAAGGRVIAVGTTALRLLETAAGADRRIVPFLGETDIYIQPGHSFRGIDGLVTNFHLPKSSLFILVSALMGRERMHAAYAHAIAQEFRFFSYGDASLLVPCGMAEAAWPGTPV